MIYLSVEPPIRTVFRSPTLNEIDFASRVWGFLCQEYDSAFTIFGLRIHHEPTRRSPGIGWNQRSDPEYHRRLPLSFRAVPRSFDIVADDHDYNRCADSAASIIYVSYERPSDSQLRCFYCTREGHKEASCQLTQDAERLRKERWSQKASAQTARVNFGDCPSEVVVHRL